MSDFEQRSLNYFMSRSCDPQWRDVLGALAEELNQQLPETELRGFFYAVGQRMAEHVPLDGVVTLEQLEEGANAYFSSVNWGWLRLRDLDNSLELAHSCAPLRQAFGDKAMSWAPALLEGLYAHWIKQLGAGDELVLHQVGQAEGDCDTLRFRLAHPSLFA